MIGVNNFSIFSISKDKITSCFVIKPSLTMSQKITREASIFGSALLDCKIHNFPDSIVNSIS